MKKNLTINDLAVIIEKGFRSINRHFDMIDKRFDKIDKYFDRLDRRLDEIEKRLSRIEIAVFDHRGRIKKLEMDVADLKKRKNH